MHMMQTHFLPVLKFYITVAICFPLFQVWVTSGFGGWIWIFPSKEKSICSSKLCFKKCCFYTFWHGLKRWSVDFNEINICSFVPFGFKFWSHNLVNISKSLSLECIITSSGSFRKIPEQMQNVVGTCSENRTMFLKIRFRNKYCKHVLTLLQCSFATDRGDSFHFTHCTCT